MLLSAVVLICFVLLLGVALFLRRKGRKQETNGIRISVAELNQRMNQHEPFVILDLRHPLDVLAAPQLIPGALPVKPDELDVHVGNIRRDSEIVVYCTCPNEESSLTAYHRLKERGFQRVKVLTGGLPAWKREHLPLEELFPELERQLRERVAATT